VFQDEKEALDRLCQLLHDKKNPFPTGVQGFIDRITRADRLLASLQLKTR